MEKESSTGSIIVVDDEKSVRDVLSRALTRKGFKVTTAEDGESALKKVSQSHFDLMFLDIKMPGISGLDVLAKMKIDHPTTTVVILTAVSGYQTQYTATKSEAFAYLMKPCKLNEVTDIAEKLLNN